MSLRKSPTRTPALLEANRRNAQKSTGPRTQRGKAQMRLNALRSGKHSRFYRDFVRALTTAPPGSVLQLGRGTLPPEMARHRLFSDFLDIAVEVEADMLVGGPQLQPSRAEGKKRILFFAIQSRNHIENKALPETERAPIPISC